MEKYINKSDVVAEIEKRIKTNKECMLGLRNLDYYQGKIDALNDTISFLNTDPRYKENFEAKEIDLNDEIDKWICDAAITHEDCSVGDVISTAKHFFELGLKAKGE